MIMTNNFKFKLLSQDQEARAGVFYTPHGEIKTPVFMPVGTQATVKSLTVDHLNDLGVQIILSNTYHLYLRPGAEIIKDLGGLHQFMNWNKPILTDSGGFQVFSLGDLRKVTDDGVLFRSHLDGSTHKFTPEFAIEIQEKLGADIIMAFDECANPDNRAYIEKALERTHAWAIRCLEVKTRSDQALFGIVQGGIYPDLREKSTVSITKLGLSGYAIGGLSVGESKQDMLAIIEVVNRMLPVSKPRYLMGVGTPYDLIESIRRGIDMFDCVLPTRLGRHHAAQTLKGRMNLSKQEYSKDPNPIDTDCECYTCRNHSRAYLRHLIIAKEMLASTLISIHNIHTLVNLVKTLRHSIINGEFSKTADRILSGICS